MRMIQTVLTTVQYDEDHYRRLADVFAPASLIHLPMDDDHELIP